MQFLNEELLVTITFTSTTTSTAAAGVVYRMLSSDFVFQNSYGSRSPCNKVDNRGLGASITKGHDIVCHS